MDKVSVLIVDDETELCNTLKNILEAQSDDYLIFTAYSGHEALPILEKEDIAVMVTDIRMPGMSGVELMRISKTLHEDLQVIILTGHGDIDNAIETLRLGANNYLRKPVSGQILHFAVMSAWEKRRLNLQLLESEAQFRSMFERNTAPMLLVDPDTGAIVNANKASTEYYGYSLQELTAMEMTAINMLPDTDVRESMEQVSSGKKKRFIFPHRLKCGEIRTVEINSTPLEVNNRMLLFSIIHDIEDRRRAEDALKSSEKRYRTLFDSANDAIFLHFFGDRIIDVNRAACERLGYTRKELLCMTYKDFTAHEYVPLIPERMEILKEKGYTVFESAHVTRTGEIIPVEGSNRIIEYSRKKAVLNISRDIRERKRAEEEKEKLQAQIRQFQKMESIGALAGGIAHDFNNILYPIIGYTQMSLDKAPEEGKIRANLKQVLNAAYRARDLIQQILTFSRQGDQERAPSRLQPVAREAMKLIRATLPSTIEIREQIDDKCGPVLADPGQIYQVIINLCVNAFHAMEEKGGMLEMSLEESDSNTDPSLLNPHLSFITSLPTSHSQVLTPHFKYLRLTVKDTGHGMDQGTMERIFNPYFTTKPPGKGAGLGLSVVHGIITGHAGHITVESELGNGSRFSVYIPGISESKDVLKILSEIPAPTGTEKILLVDDEVPIVELGKRMLENLGYTVTGLTVPGDALELFRSQPERFDLIISDTTMPEMTGPELAKELMRIRPDIPIILCTGFSELITKENAAAMGIRDVVMKPMARSEIASVIRQVLD